MIIIVKERRLKKMTLEQIIAKLLEINEDVCPCECNIPCPLYNPNNDEYYCDNGNCINGMTLLIEKIVKGEGKSIINP